MKLKVYLHSRNLKFIYSFPVLCVFHDHFEDSLYQSFSLQQIYLQSRYVDLNLNSVYFLFILTPVNGTSCVLAKAYSNCQGVGTFHSGQSQPQLFCYCKITCVFAQFSSYSCAFYDFIPSAVYTSMNASEKCRKITEA